MGYSLLIRAKTGTLTTTTTTTTTPIHAQRRRVDLVACIHDRCVFRKLNRKNY
jgi:hypothetical protein